MKGRKNMYILTNHFLVHIPTKQTNVKIYNSIIKTVMGHSKLHINLKQSEIRNLLRNV